MDPVTIAAALSALSPVIAATVDALSRGGDWRAAAREALDSAEAADQGLAGPRADEIEARHRARIAAAPVHETDLRALDGLLRGATLSHEERGALTRVRDALRVRA